MTGRMLTDAIVDHEPVLDPAMLAVLRDFVADVATNMIPAAIIWKAPRMEPGRAANRARGVWLKASRYSWSVGNVPG